MEESVTYINKLLSAECAPFKCEFTQAKGRTLRVQESSRQCEILFKGPLLHKVAEDVKHPMYIELVRLFHFDSSDSLDYGPMWYWCALNSLSFRISEDLPVISEDQSKQLKMLYHPQGRGPSATIRRVAEAIQPFLTHELSELELIELDTLTIIWTLNCFEHSEDPLTYASFFLPSFMSHSCAPTAMWTTIGETFFIRTQRCMQPGDELTVSYLSEEFGLRPTDHRRRHLQSTKFFICDCPRCTAEVDDTRGFPIPSRLRFPSTCFVRFPKFDKCACGCGKHVDMSQEEIDEFLSLESRLVHLVVEYDGDEDEIPAKPDPLRLGSHAAADKLQRLVDDMGSFHWASTRGLLQLAEFYRSKAMYPQAIALTKRRIVIRRKWIKMAPGDTSSGLAWALEELGDLVLLHVSGAVVAGDGDEARERFSDNWSPRSAEDLETLKFSGAAEAYREAVEILCNVFGEDHENTKIAISKLARLSSKLDAKLGSDVS